MKRTLSLIACLCLVVLQACHPEPFLSVSPSSLSFTEAGGSQTVQISANYPWTASVSNGFSVSPSSGEGNGSVTVTAAAATMSDPVSSSLSVKSEGLLESVSLTQDAKSTIILGDAMKVPAEGGPLEISVQYNTDFTVEIESSAQSWIKFIQTKALSSGKLVFDIAVNEGGERSGKVTVKDKGGKVAPMSVTIIQKDGKQLVITARERAALEAFYKANDGDHWENRKNWCTDAPLGDWHGVTMSIDGAHVIKLKLSEVDGYIPKEITDLTELEELTVKNRFYRADKPSPIPAEIGQLSKLKRFDFQFYSFSGTLPDELFDLTGLECLSIIYAEDMQEATIPASIGKLVKLNTLCLGRMNLTGELPPEIGNLTGLTELILFGNNLTGGVPDSFGSLLNLETVDLDCNQLSGEIPPSFFRVKNYWRLWPKIIWGNNFTQDNVRNAMIPAPVSPPVKMLSGRTLNLEEEFAKNKYTVLFKFSPDGNGAEILEQLASLYREKKDEGLGIITYLNNNISREPEKTKYDEDFKLVLKECGAEWDSFIRYVYDDYDGGAPFYANKGESLYPYGSVDELVVVGPDGTVCYTTLVDSQSQDRVDLQNALGYIRGVFNAAEEPYSSISYAEDGKVTVLQKASVGQGIDFVVTGDAFSDRMIADGTFRKSAEQAVEDFFSVEPYKSMRDRFNVYLVNAVSTNEGYFHGNSTVFSGYFSGATGLGGDITTALQYASKAVGESRMDDVIVLVLMNTRRSGGTAYMLDAANQNTYAGGASVSFVPYVGVIVLDNGMSRKAGVVIHEAAGHGFGKLADEYAAIEYGKIRAESIAFLKEGQKRGIYMNVDTTDDPEKVLWSDFIGDSRYSDEKIGTYQGGYTYYSGIWRPTQQSVMNAHDMYSTFNAPSRAQIYKRIMKLSEGQSWEFDYETFVKWDKAHPDKKAARRRSMVEIDPEESVHTTPVVVGKTWREIMR